jgi:lipid-A-disaccharide synthase
MTAKRVFISAGELSGDIHGGNLVSALKKLEPGLNITAIGGDNMATAGAELIHHIRETSFMGFAEVIKHLPAVRRLWKTTLNHLETIKPNLVIVIDYPGFNLRLAKALTKRHIPVIYYISPQVWAWRASRVEKIKRYTDQVLCILPFEEEWFQKRGVPARFVGHPLLDQIAKEQQKNETVQSIRPPAAKPFIGIFPGSRQQEVERHLPVMIDTIHRLKKKFPEIKAAVAIAPEINLEQFYANKRDDLFLWIKNRNHQIIGESDGLIMASGTATLEATILQKPFTVIYKMSGISYRLGKWLIKVPFITIGNLIADQQIVTEFIQTYATPSNIANEMEAIILNQAYRERIVRSLAEVTRQLGAAGASERAAKIILSYLKTYPNNQ